MDASPSALTVFARLLAERTGQELTTARRWRIASALEPLARAAGLPSVEALAGAVTEGRADLAGKAVEALLNNETYFYRDRPLFDLLLGPALGRLEQARAREKRLVIWCAGCSTGQEVWSLAMFFAERPSRWNGWRIDILGTDVSAAAIEQARRGAYSQFEVQRGLPVTQMLRWFTEGEGGTWRISPPPGPKLRFERHNLLEAPPPGRFDILLCRNVLLYFPPHIRSAAFSRLAAAAAPDGVLMLGAGETVIGQTESFQPDPVCRGLYTLAAPAAGARRAAS